MRLNATKQECRKAYLDLLRRAPQMKAEWQYRWSEQVACGAINPKSIIEIRCFVYGCAQDVFCQKHETFSESTFKEGGFLSADSTHHSYPGLEEWVAEWLAF